MPDGKVTDGTFRRLGGREVRSVRAVVREYIRFRCPRRGTFPELLNEKVPPILSLRDSPAAEGLDS
jgi:hypothetical protein